MISGATKSSHKAMPCPSITACTLLFESGITRLDLLGRYARPAAACHARQPVSPELSPRRGSCLTAASIPRLSTSFAIFVFAVGTDGNLSKSLLSYSFHSPTPHKIARSTSFVFKSARELIGSIRKLTPAFFSKKSISLGESHREEKYVSAPIQSALVFVPRISSIS